MKISKRFQKTPAKKFQNNHSFELHHLVSVS